MSVTMYSPTFRTAEQQRSAIVHKAAKEIDGCLDVPWESVEQMLHAKHHIVYPTDPPPVRQYYRTRL